jgi:hypothetical protein
VCLFFHSLIVSAAKPAWQDVDDQEVTVNIADKNRLRKLRMNESESNVSGTELESRLRARHSQMNPNAADWAKLPASATKQGDQDDEDNENAFLSSNASLLGMAAGKLAQGQLQITRMKDANHQEMSQVCVFYMYEWVTCKTYSHRSIYSHCFSRL